VVTMGSAQDCANGDTSVTQVQGPPCGGKTPTSFLLSIIFTVVQLSSSCSSRGGRRRWIRSPRIRVQTPLNRQGSGYRLGGRLPGYRLPVAASSA
jgi:hypothetical protein